MASLPIKLLLFGSSYAPLAVIYCFLLLPDHSVVAWCCLGLAFLCCAVLILHFEIIARRQASFERSIQSIRRRDGEVLSYLATYLLPFVSAPFADRWQVSASLFVFFAVLAVVYVNSDMIHINPVLLFLKYHLYEVCWDETRASGVVLGRGRIMVSQKVVLVDLADGIYLRVGTKERQ